MELNLHIETPISREEYVNAEVEIMKEHDSKLIDNILENYVYNKIDNLSELEFQKLCINRAPTAEYCIESTTKLGTACSCTFG